MSFGTTYSPTVPVGGAASYKPWPVFTQSNGYSEVYKHFQGDFSGWGEGLRGGSYAGGTLHGGICHGGREFPMDAGFFSIFLKSNESIHMKKFLQLKVRSSIKT